MPTEATTKTCKMCCMEIPAPAKKCPHCQHFQYQAIMVITSHPAVAVGVGLVSVIAALVILFVILERRDSHEGEEYRDQIRVTESRIVFGRLKSEETVAVVGTITNDSAIPWGGIRFQVEFLDAAGSRFDALQQQGYLYFLPAKDSLAFKVSFPREFPETNYFKHSIRVFSAYEARSRY